MVMTSANKTQRQGPCCRETPLLLGPMLPFALDSQEDGPSGSVPLAGSPLTGMSTGGSRS